MAQLVMNNELDKYKKFLDEVVSLKEATASVWVLKGSYPNTSDNEYRNEILASLPEHQRTEIAKMIQEAKESGIHDLLAFMSQECSISYQGKVLPPEPFGTELNFDFIARSEGDEWPEEP